MASPDPTLPASTQVLIAGGGPVGLASAIELGRRGVSCVVVEPRSTVSHARPRCKTINVRTMEHLRRWGIAARLRERAPLPAWWSQDIVFCTSLSGYELSSFEGVLGLTSEPDRYPETGQQAPQYVLEELFREVVAGWDCCTFVADMRVAGVEQDEDEVRVTVASPSGGMTVITADYVIGCDGARSTVREAIGARYDGEHALRPNFNMVFEAPDLWDQVRHRPAVQYWVVNRTTPAVVGRLDLQGLWWMTAFNVDRERGERDALRLVDGVAGVRTEATIVSTDPWTSHMELVDRARDRRVFLAGDAAHLNPPFGGHGMNTGIGDAVNLGWKLSAVLHGWGGPALLDSYELERRPIQTQVIEATVANSRVIASDLLVDGIDLAGEEGRRARHRAGELIQATKKGEFHSLSLVLDLGYEDSPVIADAANRVSGRAAADEVIVGGRLPHSWLSGGRALYDELGDDMTLVVLTPGRSTATLIAAARARDVPLCVLDLSAHDLRSKYGADLVLVRPDQHIAWAADRPPKDAVGLLDQLRGGIGG
jgi:2-polyprenyl-6-methoxyphenol hydroxylase-like FAD-dependent oxidoreductase